MNVNDTKDLGPVMVIAGGLSTEREVSLRSGARVGAALRRAGVDTRLRDVDADLLTELAADPPEVVFPLLHGIAGEDGTIQEVLELAGVPYVGAPPGACRITFDKAVAKELLQRQGIKTPVAVTLPKRAFHDLGAGQLTGQIIRRLGLPLYVKPRAGGSAFGVTRVDSGDELPQALMSCFGHHDVALIEQCIHGQEIAVAVTDLGDGPAALPAVEIVSEGPYDYSARYTAGSVEFHTPARLSPGTTREAAEIAVRAHRVLGLRHLSRTDAIVTEGGEIYVLETNIAPGMTETSSVPLALEAAGFNFAEFCRAIVTEAARGHRSPNRSPGSTPAPMEPCSPKGGRG